MTAGDITTFVGRGCGEHLRRNARAGLLPSPTGPGGTGPVDRAIPAGAALHEGVI
jgi:hypothetical protein